MSFLPSAMRPLGSPRGAHHHQTARRCARCVNHPQLVLRKIVASPMTVPWPGADAV